MKLSMPLPATPRVTGRHVDTQRVLQARAIVRDARSGGPCGSVEQLKHWLQPEAIMVDVDAWDRRRALEMAAAHIGQAHGLDPAPIFRALWRREQVGSTGIGHGVAIPHARIAGIARPLTLFIRTKLAMPFDAPDGKPVSKILVMLVPVDGNPEEHLQLLALVARMFSDSTLRARLGEAANAEEVAAVFGQWQGELPA